MQQKTVNNTVPINILSMMIRVFSRLKTALIKTFAASATRRKKKEKKRKNSTL